VRKSIWRRKAEKTGEEASREVYYLNWKGCGIQEG
jgi:hypothetical protein